MDIFSCVKIIKKMYNKILLPLILLISFQYCIANITIRKCCPLNYHLNEAHNGCQLSNFNTTSKWNLDANLTRNLPKDFQISVPTNISTLNVAACKPAKTMMWPDDFEISVDGKVSTNTSKIPDFCLDVIRKGTDEVQVAVTCPCMSVTCLNVCCPEKQMMMMPTQLGGK